MPGPRREEIAGPYAEPGEEGVEPRKEDLEAEASTRTTRDQK